MAEVNGDLNLLFQSGPGRNVVLNRRLPDDTMFGLYARRYHRAAKLLAVQMEHPGGFNDIDACPVLFLYRHSLELYLKSIVRFGHRYSTYSGIDVQVGEKALMSSHKLLDLLQAVRQTFKAAGWTWQLDVDGVRTFGDFERRVREFAGVDEGSYAFRYPVNTAGDASIAPEFRFNMQVFRTHMDNLLDALDTAVFGLSAELDQLDDLTE